MCLFTKSAARPIFNKYSDRSMEVKVPGLLGNYERPTDQPTKQQTDRLTDIRVHWEVTLPEYYNRTLYEQKSAVTSILKGVKSFVQGLFL